MHWVCLDRQWLKTVVFTIELGHIEGYDAVLGFLVRKSSTQGAYICHGNCYTGKDFAWNWSFHLAAFSWAFIFVWDLCFWVTLMMFSFSRFMERNHLRSSTRTSVAFIHLHLNYSSQQLHFSQHNSQPTSCYIYLLSLPNKRHFKKIFSMAKILSTPISAQI